MNKSFSKYKKSRWIKTRLSKPHKSRIAFRKIQAAAVVAQAIATVSQIKMAGSFDKAGKAAAIDSTVLNAFVAASKVMQPVNSNRG